jgi:hypothetical protein
VIHLGGAIDSMATNRHRADVSAVCSDRRPFSIAAGAISAVVVCRNPGNSSLIKFSFRSTADVDWSLHSDGGVILASGTSASTHFQHEITVTNGYEWVGVFLRCRDAKTPCGGFAKIVGGVDLLSSEATRSERGPVQSAVRPKLMSTSPDCYSYSDSNLKMDANSYYQFCEDDIQYLEDGSTIGNITWNVDADSHFVWLHWGWSFGPGSCGNTFNEVGKERMWDVPSNVASTQYGDESGYGYWTIQLECSDKFLGCNVPSVSFRYCVTD